MKSFDNVAFDFHLFKKELGEFGQLLDDCDELSERAEILPFFRQRRLLSSQIATHHPNIVPQLLSYEFDIGGDFTCDVAVGDPDSQTFCFIEFEDAKRDSLFVKRPTKFSPEYANRLEHGISQVVDWFYKLDDLQKTNSMQERFGSPQIDYEGMLVIGRSKYLDSATKSRIDWRFRHTIIRSKKILFYTYDELYKSLEKKLHALERER